jgi:hypothetical protein
VPPTPLADIEAAAAKLRSKTKAVVLGPDAVQAQKPEDRPARPKKSYAPLFHAFSRRLRRETLRRLPLVLGRFPGSLGETALGRPQRQFSDRKLSARPTVRDGTIALLSFRITCLRFPKNLIQMRGKPL